MIEEEELQPVQFIINWSSRLGDTLPLNIDVQWCGHYAIRQWDNTTVDGYAIVLNSEHISQLVLIVTQLLYLRSYLHCTNKHTSTANHITSVTLIMFDW